MTQAQIKKPIMPPAIAPETVGLKEIESIEQASYSVIENLRDTVFTPDGEKRLDLRFSISQAAEMAKRSPEAIRQAEASGRLPPPERGSNGRREPYTLEQVNHMRAVFGTLPYRNPETDGALTLAVQNFKGGVGKSTITAHLGQYLALQGYRVCIIDCDPQGSTTSLFGINPDFDLDEGDTLYPFLRGDHDLLDYAVRPTYWDQVAIIPANLFLYQVEYELAARLARSNSDEDRRQVLGALRQGISSIKDGMLPFQSDALGERPQADPLEKLRNGFDIILIDPPPALGMISLSVLSTADALIVPCRPATIDFNSTAHFFTMLRESLGELEEHGIDVSFKFMKVLANGVDDGKSAHTRIASMMRQVYGSSMLSTELKDSAEIDNACGRLMTVYESSKPITSREVHRRARTYLDGVSSEIETLIRKTWPSQQENLRREGLL